MKKVLLIGGSPCSGKSTLADYLSKKLGYQYIRIDDYMGKHIEEAGRDKPILYLWQSTPWHQLFSRPVDVQLDEEIRFYHEEWDFLKRDILRDITSDKVIIEGCGLLPSFVDSLVSEKEIFYMVPTEEFQVEKYALRTWAFDLLKESDDPQKAFDNWMERDMAFAKYVAGQAREYQYQVIIMDGQRRVEDIAHEVITRYHLT